MASVKVLQNAAMELEDGLTENIATTDGWGGSTSAATLGAGDLLPYLSFGKNFTIGSTEDNTIVSNGFKALPRQISKMSEYEISLHPRFKGIDKLWYVIFGFVNTIVPTIAVVITDTTSIANLASNGGTGFLYTDVAASSGNSFEYLRKEINGINTYYIFGLTDSILIPVGGATGGTLYNISDDNITYDSCSADVMYESTYELDALTREIADYTTAEKTLHTSLYSIGDKKNRSATFGIALGTVDHRYKNSMCQGFTFTSQAAGLSTLSVKLVGRGEERGDYSSSAWTPSSDVVDNEFIPAHHQIGIQFGTTDASYVSLAATDVSIECSIPLQKVQDTVSGLYLTEPCFEGKYEVSATITLSRYSSETFQALRDSFSEVTARIFAEYLADDGNSYMLEFIIADAIITDGGPDDSDVAKEVLILKTGFSTSYTKVANILEGVDTIQGGPMVMRTRNLNSVNPMFIR